MRSNVGVTQIVAVSPQVKCRLSKSARRYLTDFGVSRMSTRLELPSVARGEFVPTAAGRLQRML